MVIPLLVAVPGDKLLFREGNAAEHFTGILSTAARSVAAFLGGNAVIQHRHDNLGIPLQTDDGELTQRDEQAAVIVAQHQFLVEHILDVRGNLRGQFLTGTVADLLHFGAENHGIQHFHREHQFARL